MTQAPSQLDTGHLTKMGRSLSYILMVAVALVIWDGNITAIEIKDVIVQVGCLIIALLACCAIIIQKEIRVPLDPLMLLIVIFLALVTLRFAFTNQSSINIRAVVPQLCGPLFFLLMVFFFDTIDVVKISRLLALVATVASIHGILQYFNVDFVSWIDKGFVFATFGQKNVFALFLVLQIPVTLYLAVQSNRKRLSPYWLSLAALMFVCLLLSRSRGALASFVVLSFAMSTFFFFRRREHKTKEMKYCLFFSLTLLAIVLGGYKVTLPQLQGLMNAKAPSVVQRLAYYKSAVEVIKESPFVGVGPGNFLIAYPQHAKDAETISDPNTVTKHVHSDFLEIWAEYGIFTLFVYIVILGTFVKRLIMIFLAGGSSDTPILSLLFLLSLGSYILYTQISEGGRYMSSLFYFWTLLAICYLFVKGNGYSCNYLRVKNFFTRTAKITTVTYGLLALSAAFVASRVYANYASDVFLAESLRYSNEKNYKTALQILTKAVDLNDRSIEALYQKGYLLFAFEKNYDATIECFKDVYQLAPGYTNTAFNIASSYYRKKNFPEAINWLSITTGIYHEYTPALMLLAECYFNTADFEKSLFFAEETLKILDKRIRSVSVPPRAMMNEYNKVLALKSNILSINTKQMGVNVK